MSEGFKALGTDLFDLSAELDRAVVVILSGRDSADAQRYHEKDVQNALRDLAKLEEEDLE
jgi:hypothetical protein